MEAAHSLSSDILQVGWYHFHLVLGRDFDLEDEGDLDIANTGERRGGGSDEQRGGDRGGRPQTSHRGSSPSSSSTRSSTLLSSTTL